MAQGLAYFQYIIYLLLVETFLSANHISLFEYTLKKFLFEIESFEHLPIEIILFNVPASKWIFSESEIPQSLDPKKISSLWKLQVLNFCFIPISHYFRDQKNSIGAEVNSSADSNVCDIIPSAYFPRKSGMEMEINHENFSSHRPDRNKARINGVASAHRIFFDDFHPGCPFRRRCSDSCDPSRSGNPFPIRRLSDL